MTLLQVQDLRVHLRVRGQRAAAVRGVSFALERGRTLALIGESGCGKTLTALALMGLLPPAGAASGSIRLQERELTEMSERQWCAIRGDRIAMIFQEPMTALNPVHPIGRQVAEPLRLHRRLPARAARERAAALLARAGIAQAGQRLGAYPHQFSGGERQRIMVAMALACAPQVLIADEPTTALDTTLQRQVLALMREPVAQEGMALILISHDLGLVGQHADHLLVMYGGAVMESGPTAQIFRHPAHPYTRALLAARPTLAQRLAGHPGEKLPTIAGAVPPLLALPPGCPFAGRCPHTEARCHTDPPPEWSAGEEHTVRCHRREIP